MADLVIKNGVAVTPCGLINGGVAVVNGRIVQVGPDETLPRGDRVVDAGGKYILPGIIDPHTHLHSLGDNSLPFPEAIRTESASAAVTGITTLVSTPHVPGKLPKQHAAMRQLREAAEKTSLVDFKFNTIIFFDSHIEEIPALVPDGFNVFKFLMGYSGDEAAAMGLVGLHWGLFYRAAEMIARVGPPAIQLVHCEEPEIGHMLIERFKAEGRKGLDSWEEARPSVTEGMHAFTAGLIAYHVGSPLYIVHIASEESLEAVAYLRRKGVRLWTETCTHYLVLSKHSPFGPLAKCSPPLRDERMQDLLWKAIADGTIGVVGSDQCMIPRASKEKGIWDAQPGTGLIGSVFPVMMTDGVGKGRIDIERFSKVCSENPARAMGMYPKKGVLSPGSDADIIIVDPEPEWTISTKSVKTALEYTAYDGYRARGRVKKTFVRGTLVAEDGEIVAAAPGGRYIR